MSWDLNLMHSSEVQNEKQIFAFPSFKFQVTMLENLIALSRVLKERLEFKYDTRHSC